MNATHIEVTPGVGYTVRVRRGSSPLRVQTYDAAGKKADVYTIPAEESAYFLNAYTLISLYSAEECAWRITPLHLTGEGSEGGGEASTEGALAAHVSDDSLHVSATERAAWNAKADGARLAEHTEDTSLHITEEERAAWNAKADGGTGGGDNSALEQHANDTDIHITAEERAKWNNGTGSGSSGDSTALTNHIADAVVHITEIERAKWNNNSIIVEDTATLGNPNAISSGGAYALSLHEGSGTSSVQVGEGARATGKRSVALGYEASASADDAVALGYKANNAHAGTHLMRVVINEGLSTENLTYFWLIGAGSAMSTEYCAGKAGLGYIVYNGNGLVTERGTIPLASLLTDNTSSFLTSS